MDCNFKQKYDDSKIARTYDERIDEVIGYKIQKSVIRDLKKAAMALSMARVHCGNAGSQNFERDIFNIEDKIWNEINDIRKRSLLKGIKLQ